MDTMAQLAKAVESLRDADASRDDAMAERDRLIRAARDEGRTWASIQEVTGLTARSIALALARNDRALGLGPAI